MDENLITAVGIFAAVTTTGSWIPQALQTIRSKSAEDFSWAYLGAFMTGISAWLVYGMMKKDLAIIGANAVTLALLFPIAVVKYREKRT
jgi:MtN3 and saliva related transmembrane protein